MSAAGGKADGRLDSILRRAHRLRLSEPQLLFPEVMRPREEALCARDNDEAAKELVVLHAIARTVFPAKGVRPEWLSQAWGFVIGDLLRCLGDDPKWCGRVASVPIEEHAPDFPKDPDVLDLLNRLLKELERASQEAVRQAAGSLPVVSSMQQAAKLSTADRFPGTLRRLYPPA